MAGKVYLCLVDCRPDVNGAKPYCRADEQYIFPNDWEPPNTKGRPPKFKFLRNADPAEAEEAEEAPARTSAPKAKGTVNGRHVAGSKKAAPAAGKKSPKSAAKKPGKGPAQEGDGEKPQD